MIVVDASAITELLLQTALGTRVERRLYREDDDLHAPHLLDVEVLSALRRLPLWSAPVLPRDGKVPVEMTFSEPGTYVLRCRADDGALVADQDVTIVVVR